MLKIILEHEYTRDISGKPISVNVEGFKLCKSVMEEVNKRNIQEAALFNRQRYRAVGIAW